MSSIFYYLYTWQPSTCVDLGLLGPHMYIWWPYHGSCSKKIWLGMFGVFGGLSDFFLGLLEAIWPLVVSTINCIGLCP